MKNKNKLTMSGKVNYFTETRNTFHQEQVWAELGPALVLVLILVKDEEMLPDEVMNIDR